MSATFNTLHLVRDFSNKINMQANAIITFTLRYDLIEDRMCLDVLKDDGLGEKIYITRRLANGIIAELGRRIENLPARVIPTEFIQEQAVQSKTPVAAVEIHEGSPSWLLKTMHIAPKDNQLMITLTDDESHAVEFQASEHLFRNMLEFFWVNFNIGEWTTEHFPTWFVEAKLSPVSAATLN